MAITTLCALLLATSCSSSDDTAAPSNTVATTETAAPETEPETTSTSTTTTSSTTTTTSTTTTAAAATDEEQILATVERLYELLTVVNDPPDPAFEGWSEIGTPDYVSALQTRSQDFLDSSRGVRASDTPVAVTGLTVQFAENGTALANFCLRDSAITYDLADGSVIDDSIIFVSREAVVEESSEGWLIAVNHGRDTFESEEACIESLP